MTDLATLAAAVPGARVIPSTAGMRNVPIAGLAFDSRRVAPGDLFFCIRGAESDGHRFLPDAIRCGAVAAVVEDEAAAGVVPTLLVASTRSAMPSVAACFHGYPSRKLRLAGVTGTNGKTTTTLLVAALAAGAGFRTGTIGTVGVTLDGETLEAQRTTPEAPDLQAWLARMTPSEDSRPSLVAMEVSSHALEMERTAGCEFDVAVFTNLTQDHLDYHGDMESYYRAKRRLFTEYPSRTRKRMTAVVNVDDPYGRRLAEESTAPVVTYAIERDADLRAANLRVGPTSLEYHLQIGAALHHVRLGLGARFNVYNSLAALAAGRALGLEMEGMLHALEGVAPAPGRFESISTNGLGFSVLVDYAHSPDGLENVLRSARALSPCRLVVVFGCGGNRDRTKRPIMGRIAAELADHVILTSDNPRKEEPAAILDEIASGIPDDAPASYERCLDRREAIRRAVDGAQEGDLVVIAGKGHEDYQIFADRTIHFDDREEARRAIDARHSA